MTIENATHYDALLFVSFGGPEGREDVLPFLENVLRGKPVPRERMLEVAEHYYHFDGISPINGQNRDLIQAVKMELEDHVPLQFEILLELPDTPLCEQYAEPAQESFWWFTIGGWYHLVQVCAKGAHKW